MKITFLGTRGYIEEKTRRHFRHTSTLIEYHGKKIMIDCGIDWTKKVWDLNPDAIVITHAHPDHAWGLREGAPCPVYASTDSWKLMADYPIVEKHIMHDGKKREIFDTVFQTYSVIHSIRAPAVGYRIIAGKSIIFCAHDLISINARHQALQGSKIYIGDGASILRPLVRRRGDKIFGHTTVRAQLGWCQQEGVPKMIVTHCGKQIVSGGRGATMKIKALAKERNVKVIIAYDGFSIRI
jgi:phosphoribosyl 1,2-cyclic phosphodiesterase